MIRILSLTLSILTFQVLAYSQTDWTVRQSNSGDLLNDVVFTDDTFVVVGTTTAPVTVLTSPDGITWTRQDAGIGGIFHSVAYGNGRVVAVGTNTASSIAGVSTDDGVTWAGGPTGIGLTFDGVAWTGSEFVAVGGTGGNAVIATSPDGTTWTGGTIGVASNLKAIVSEGTTRVAAGSTGVILYSLDGGAWTTVPNTPNVDWEGVSYAAGQFLVVGVQGQIMTSPDGITWTLGSSGTGDNLFAVTSIGVPQVWVSVGSNGRIIVSNDASSWTTLLPAPTLVILDGVAWGIPTGGTSSLFVTVGNLGEILTAPGPDLGGAAPATFASKEINVSSRSQSFSVQVTAGAAVNWNASTGADWISLGSASGTSNGTVSGSVSANRSAQSRSATVSIGTDTLTIEQAGADLTPPSFLSANYSENDGGIRLSWGSVPAAAEFLIERRASDEDPWEVVYTITNEPTTSTIDDTITKGNSYQYRIQSISGDLESGWTDPINGGSPPDTPDDLTATARNATQIELSWSDVNGETGYRIRRGLADSFFDANIAIPANETRYIDVGLNPETAYKYTIEPISNFFGGPSPEVTETTLEISGSIQWGQAERVSNNYNGVAYGNGIAVVVGDSGRITQSTDLANWADLLSQTEVDLLDVHFADNLFVAVGQMGTTLYSSDGLSWTVASNASNESLVSVTYLNEWYAVGAEGALVTSTDGISWSALTSPAESGFVDIFAGPKLVAIEDTGRFITSENGTSWSETRADSPPDATEPFFWTRTAGTYGGGAYGVVGPASYTSTSVDGTSWANQTSGQFQYFNAVAFGGGRFVAVAGRSGYSSDGSFYLEGNDPPSLLSCITYTGSVFLAAGDRGLIATSSDGTSWTTVQETEGSAANLSLVANGGGRLVALGSRFNNNGFRETVTIFNKLDGNGWSDEVPLTVDGITAEPLFTELVYLNNQFFLLGSNGAILTSSNGESFVTRNAVEGFSGPTFSSVAYNNGRYLAGGAGSTLFESTDEGITWTTVEDLPSGFGAKFLNHISRWSGGSGEHYSEDGVNWMPTSVSGFGGNLQVGAFGSYGNAPILVNLGSGFSGTDASISWDGRNWNLRSFESDSLPNTSFNSLAYGSGVFVATSTPNESGDAIWASRDGVHWEPAPDGVFGEDFFNNGSIQGLTFNESDGAFYGVGGGGLVARVEVSSSDFVPPGPEHRLGIGLNGNLVKIEWPTYGGYNYLLRFNHGLDPANWISIGNPEAGDGSIKTYEVSLDAITLPQFWSLQIEEN